MWCRTPSSVRCASAIRSLGAAHSMRGCGGSLSTWLGTHGRVSGRVDGIEQVGEFVGDEFQDDERRQVVREAIEQLPERQRLVLFLRVYADLDYRAIAEAVGIREGTVAATLNAAHSRLRELLSEARR